MKKVGSKRGGEKTRNKGIEERNAVRKKKREDERKTKKKKEGNWEQGKGAREWKEGEKEG